MIYTNLHNPTGAKAASSRGAAWLDIGSDAGSVTIFMPSLDAALSVASAFNDALDTKTQAAHDRKVLAGLL